MIILITGGSKCGKSKIAEDIIASYDMERIYIATMIPYGEEAFNAIERHRNIRSNKNFHTVEKYTDIHQVEINKNSVALIECAGNLCANEMFENNIPDPTEKIVSGILEIAKKAKVLVVVTNQVGEDGKDYGLGTMKYIQNLGAINRKISAAADIVIEAVCGIPVYIKRKSG